MLARRKAKLPFYLNALREKEYAEKYPGCLLNNFHNLLRFWQRHYLNKDKDSTCLENVSSFQAFSTHNWSICKRLNLWLFTRYISQAASENLFCYLMCLAQQVTEK